MKEQHRLSISPFSQQMPRFKALPILMLSLAMMIIQKNTFTIVVHVVMQAINMHTKENVVSSTWIVGITDQPRIK